MKLTESILTNSAPEFTKLTDQLTNVISPQTTTLLSNFANLSDKALDKYIEVVARYPKMSELFSIVTNPPVSPKIYDAMMHISAFTSVCFFAGLGIEAVMNKIGIESDKPGSLATLLGTSAFVIDVGLHILPEFV